MALKYIKQSERRKKLSTHQGIRISLARLAKGESLFQESERTEVYRCFQRHHFACRNGKNGLWRAACLGYQACEVAGTSGSDSVFCTERFSDHIFVAGREESLRRYQREGVLYPAGVAHLALVLFPGADGFVSVSTDLFSGHTGR